MYDGSSLPMDKPYSKTIHCQDMSDLNFYLELFPARSHKQIDVVEMFSGMGGAFRVTISRKLIGGEMLISDAIGIC